MYHTLPPDMSTESAVCYQLIAQYLIVHPVLRRIVVGGGGGGSFVLFNTWIKSSRSKFKFCRPFLHCWDQNPYSLILGEFLLAIYPQIWGFFRAGIPVYPFTCNTSLKKVLLKKTT